MWVEPSTTFSAPVRVTVGATLLTVTGRLAVLPAALSELVAWTVTVGLAGPSGKVHLKLPAVSLLESEPATSWPPVPQLTATELTVSVPGSLIE